MITLYYIATKKIAPKIDQKLIRNPGGENIQIATLQDPANPHGKDMLRPDGRAPSPGQIMTNANLARTFRALSEGGKAAFYTGKIAESVARCVRGRDDRKSQVRQCLSFCSADSYANKDPKSAVQNPKHCLT